MQPNSHSSFEKLKVDNSCQKTRKIRYYIFEALPNFIVSLYFVPNILSRIAVHKTNKPEKLVVGICDILQQTSDSFYCFYCLWSYLQK